MVRKFAVILYFLIMGTGFLAVAQRIDAAYENNLKSQLKMEGSDTAKVSILIKLNRFYLGRYLVKEQIKDTDSALVVIQNAVKLGKRIGDQARVYESIQFMGGTYLYLKDTIRAHRCIRASLNYLQANMRYDQMIKYCTQFGQSAKGSKYNLLSLPYYELALSIAVNHNIKNQIVFCETNILSVEGLANRDVLKDGLKLIAKYRNSGENIDRIYVYVAQVYRYKGDLKKALGYALDAEKVMERHGDTAVYSYVYAELALNYDVLGEAEKSIYYYKKTLQERNKLVIKEEYKYRTLGFIIKNLIKLGRPNDGLKELTVYEKSYPPQTNFGVAFCDQNKAYCYQALGDYNRAEYYFVRLIKSPIMSDAGEISCLAYYDISKFYILKKDFNLAQYYLTKSNCMTAAFDNVKNLEQLRYKIDSALGNYKAAMEHYVIYQRVKDSIFSKSALKEISELQLKYETSKKEKDIALLKKDSQIQRNSLRQAGHVRNITFGGLILLSFALLFLYTVLINNRKKSKVIDQKNLTLNHLLEEKDELLDEKEWLIKEIHHRVKNNLQIVIGLLQRQSSYVDNDVALKAIQNSENRMHAIALIHQKLYQVDTLDQINTQEYINDLILHLQENADTDSNIVFVKNVELIFLDVSQAVPLGLILNEAITNAIKYAYPEGKNGKIYVEFKSLPEGFNLLTVRDEGEGFGEDFDMNTIKTMGINLMRGLSKQLGGAFNVNYDNGVVIEIKFKSEPVTAEQ